MMGLIDRIRRFIFGSPDPSHHWDREEDPFVQRMQDETKESKDNARESRDWLSIPISERFVGYRGVAGKKERGRDDIQV